MMMEAGTLTSYSAENKNIQYAIRLSLQITSNSNLNLNE